MRNREHLSYNLFLLLRLPNLLREDALIIHNPFHFIPVWWHKHTIAVSHGVTWQQPPTTLTQKIKKQIAKLAFKHSRKFVANDSNFFREMGINIKPKQRMFQQVTQGKWFIPNCVDTDLFKRNKGIRELKKLNPVLVPRNIVRGRGIHLAIEAFSKFIEVYKDTSMVIAGNFYEPLYKNYVFSLINNLRLAGKVYFVGNVKRESMVSFYSSSLMTLIPTLYEEGTSLSALESMACETPTISTDVGGLADLPSIQCKANPEDLAKAMIEVAKNRVGIAKQQHQEVTNTYNLENWEKAWLKVLQL